MEVGGFNVFWRNERLLKESLRHTALVVSVEFTHLSLFPAPFCAVPCLGPNCIVFCLFGRCLGTLVRLEDIFGVPSGVLGSYSRKQVPYSLASVSPLK